MIGWESNDGYRSEVKGRGIQKEDGYDVWERKGWSEKRRDVARIGFESLLGRNDVLLLCDNKNKENGMKCENVNEGNDIQIINNKNDFTFISKIPKPSSSYSIKYNKYSEMPTKIPKPSST